MLIGTEGTVTLRACCLFGRHDVSTSVLSKLMDYDVYLHHLLGIAFFTFYYMFSFVSWGISVRHKPETG